MKKMGSAERLVPINWSVTWSHTPVNSHSFKGKFVQSVHYVFMFECMHQAHKPFPDSLSKHNLFYSKGNRNLLLHCRISFKQLSLRKKKLHDCWVRWDGHSELIWKEKKEENITKIKECKWKDQGWSYYNIKFLRESWISCFLSLFVSFLNS